MKKRLGFLVIGVWLSSLIVIAYLPVSSPELSKATTYVVWVPNLSALVDGDLYQCEVFTNMSVNDQREIVDYIEVIDDVRGHPTWLARIGFDPIAFKREYHLRSLGAGRSGDLLWSPKIDHAAVGELVSSVHKNHVQSNAQGSDVAVRIRAIVRNVLLIFVYVLSIAVLLCLLRSVWVWHRSNCRKRAHQCIACGYPLDRSGKCSECGACCY